MTSPSTATDPAPFDGDLGSLARLVEEEGLVDALRVAGACHADLYCESAEYVQEEARIRNVRGRLSTPSFWTRSTSRVGIAAHGFSDRRRCLLWTDEPEIRTARRLVRAFRLALSSAGAAVEVLPLDRDAGRPEESRVHQEPWARDLVERLVDACFSQDERVGSLRVARVRRQRSGWVATPEGGIIPVHAEGQTMRLEASISGATGTVTTAGLPSDPEDLAARAVRAAQSRLEADRSFVGDMPVVVAGGRGGAWLHEALGHLLEADVEALGFTPHALGAVIGPPSITVLDDPRRPEAIVRYARDDEGVSAATTPLVVDGRVERLLVDRYHGHHLDAELTGNGRRSSYRHLPMPRMSHLVMRGGDASLDDLLKAADSGMLVRRFSGGCVFGRGNRVRLDVEEAYRIEGGRVGAPVDHVVLEVAPVRLLHSIVAIAQTSEVDAAPGMCVKADQVLPVSAEVPGVLFGSLAIRARAEGETPV